MNGETVVRLRATATKLDAYSNEQVPDWSQPPAELPLETLAPAEPRPSDEPSRDEPVLDARNAVVSGWTLYLPIGADVTAYDRMRVRGVVYPVLGQPADWLGAGIVVQCARTEG